MSRRAIRRRLGPGARRTHFGMKQVGRGSLVPIGYGKAGDRAETLQRAASAEEAWIKASQAEMQAWRKSLEILICTSTE